MAGFPHGTSASVSFSLIPPPRSTTFQVGGHYTNSVFFGVVVAQITDIRVVLNTGEEFPAELSGNDQGGTWSATIVLRLAGHHTMTAIGHLASGGTVNSLTAEVTVLDPGVSTLAVASPLRSPTHHYTLSVEADSPIGIASVTSPTLGALHNAGGTLWQTSVRIDGGQGTTLPVTVTAKTNGSGVGDGLTKTISATIALVDTTPPALTWTAPPADGQEITGGQVDIAVQAVDDAGDVVATGVNGLVATLDPDTPSVAAVPLASTDGRTWRATVPLATGSHTVLVSATDFAGNESSATRQVDRELLAPGQWLDLGQPPGQPTAAGPGPTPGVDELIGAVAVWDDPSAASSGLHLFVHGSDGHLWADRFDGQRWQWEDHGRPGAAGPVPEAGPHRVGVLGVLRDPPDLLTATYVFVIGPDGHVWSRWTAVDPWQWTDLGAPGGSPIDSGVGVAPQGGAGPAVFVQGGDGQLWVKRWPSPTEPPPDWTPLRVPQGRLLAAECGVAVAAHAFAVFLTDDGHLWINNADASPSSWIDLLVPTSTAAVSLPFGVTAVQHAAGPPRVRAFVTSTDTGALWANESDGHSGSWTPLGPSNGGPPGFSSSAGTRTGIAATSRSATGVVADDGHLWIFNWDPDAGVAGWDDAGTPGNAAPPPDIAQALVFAAPVAGNRAAAHGYTLVATADGHLWIRRDRHD